MNKSPSDFRQSAGFVGGLIRHARLAWRLFKDARVPGWVKLIPIGGLFYLLSPIDLLPEVVLPGLGELDDLALLLLSMKVFVDLSPPGIVREHLEQLFGLSGESHTTEKDPSSVSYIDAPYHVVDEDKE